MGLTDKDNEEKDIEYYSTTGSIRYVTFIQEDGKRLSLPYSLLPTIEFEPGEEQQTITLTFPNHKVVLTGYNLEQLSKELESERVRWISVFVERYIASEKRGESIVLQISL